jgi:hypothetical protein
MAARMPTMATTIMSSIRVMPCAALERRGLHSHAEHGNNKTLSCAALERRGLRSHAERGNDERLSCVALERRDLYSHTERGNVGKGDLA